MAIAKCSPIDHLFPENTPRRTGYVWRRETQPLRFDLDLAQIDFLFQFADIVVCSNVFDQAVYCPTNRVDVSALATDCARVLAIWGMALDDEALSKTELACVHDVVLIASCFVPDGDGCSLAYHPEVFAGHVESNAACRTCAAASRGEGCCQRVSGHVL